MLQLVRCAGVVITVVAGAAQQEVDRRGHVMRKSMQSGFTIPHFTAGAPLCAYRSSPAS